ncbi:zinc transporter 1 like protein [Danaus plexippus plexippus]|uniref:Zinc transporter 1 like protein n=1 Tax=Danaus plexippus plexippus TaxID=278856 RepID=A0A212FI09_DANPL|nr:zinc transporter 1 like protein [Danaus plexippus plexippus]
MAMKEWLQWLPPPRSLMALLIAITGFGGRMCAAYVTHSPTLLVDACHSLCRLVGLVTTLLAYKYQRADEGAGREGRLRNTFGWTRIEVVGRLSVHVLFASFALALVVNALQLGVHSSHVTPPKFPRVIVLSAVVGLLLHATNYMLLAGRELSYSRRLSIAEGGDVVLKSGTAEPVLAHAPTDIASSLFVMAAGLTLEWEPVAARIADPALSAAAAITLVIFNYPFMRSAGLVLLQTVPEGLGAGSLREAALRVRGVLAVHELHVWQLHRDRIVATAHIFYESPEDYLSSAGLVCDVFKRHGISLVTLQPEFIVSADSDAEERKMLIEFANTACSCPCAKDCSAPRCCQAPRRPSVTRV